MKKHITNFAFLALTLNAGAAAAASLDSVGIVHYDNANADTFFNFVAAAPIFNYAESGEFERLPLFNDADKPLETDDTAASLWVIGDAAENAVAKVRDNYEIPANRVIRVNGGVCEVAAGLATNWVAAGDVVVAVYVPGGDKEAQTGAAFAAALATTLNAPLLYTYAAYVPIETANALRATGARRVWFVDFGSASDAGVVRALTSTGRTLAGEFHAAEDVNRTINTQLRRDKKRPTATSI